MSKLSDIDKFVILYDYYKNVLTKIQQQDFEMYLFEDMSLDEIAEKLHKSKTAVFDNIKKVQKNLLDLEDKLQLAEKGKNFQEILDKIASAETYAEVQEFINKLKGDK